MKVITEADLRTAYSRTGNKNIRVGQGFMLTQPARDYIREQGLTVVGEYDGFCADGANEPSEGFVDTGGKRYREKPEHMTHLRGRLLVPKSHPRIELRGKLDSLQAKILEVQIVAHRNGETGVVVDLEDALAYTRYALAAEVKDAQFDPPPLLGFSDAMLREVSHNPQAHFGIPHILPSYLMGETVVALNALRAAVRETELAAVRAFPDDAGSCARPDLIRALNRLSSGVYIMICRVLSHFYDGGTEDG